MRFSFYIICLLFSLSSGILSAEVRLPAIISDNMVLQQRTKVTLWGKASPGEKVLVQPSWSKKGYSTKANGDGKWLLRIQTPAATTGQSILIEGTNRIRIENVLIGEVWLCSGQSNMEFPVSKGESWRTGISDEEKEMQDANYPEIRLFQVKHQVSPDREMDECEGVWLVCNREHLKTFSAVAFFFARDIYKEIRMPVGLIQSTWGGTPAEAWTKPSVIASDPVYVGLIRDYERMQVNYPSDLENYRKELEEYETKRISGSQDLRPPRKPLGVYDPKVLSTLWNGMIHPLLSYRIRGVIWYQGESNSARAGDYNRVFTNLINSWRKEWRQKDLPFYFVLIAPHKDQSPLLREAQLQTWQNVKNTGMAVITDVGDSIDIHPRNKLVPGKRLAGWALAKTYRIHIPYSGPLYHKARFKEGKAVLSFRYSDDSLLFQGQTSVGFEIAGADRLFYPAGAVIKGKTIEVSSPEVSRPVAVRYGWGNYFEVNLYSGAGLPATPFRTDHW